MYYHKFPKKKRILNLEPDLPSCFQSMQKKRQTLRPRRRLEGLHLHGHGPAQLLDDDYDSDSLVTLWLKT